MTEKLIPYSIHLKPEMYARVKQAAGERKASELIRRAIETYLENQADYEAGYKAGWNEAADEIKYHPVANSIGWRGQPMSELLYDFLRILEKDDEE